ncbi:MAG: DUF1559 domain-containing protein [Gemmataceae bacterium]|nr:DUF1559 domain-containing protein [Gemmataceae bacterium]
MNKLAYWLTGTTLGCLTLAGFVCFCCLTFSGFGAYILPPIEIVAGWIGYIARFREQYAIDWFIVGIVATTWGGVFVVSEGVGRVVAYRYLPSRSWSLRWSFAITCLLMLVGGAGVAFNNVAFNSQKLATMEESMFRSDLENRAHRTLSMNNLKNFGLAAHDFADDSKHLPAGGTFDDQGRAMHGWQTLLLPYIDHQPLFQRIDLKQPWSSTHNTPAMQTEVPGFLNPAILYNATDGFALSHYAANVHVLGPKALRVDEITDGTSNTILMGEVIDNFSPWGRPGNWRDPALGLNKSPHGFGGPWRHGMLVVMADGSVRLLPHDIDPNVLKAIGTPRGGEGAKAHAIED